MLSDNDFNISTYFILNKTWSSDFYVLKCYHPIYKIKSFTDFQKKIATFFHIQ